MGQVGFTRSDPGGHWSAMDGNRKIHVERRDIPAMTAAPKETIMINFKHPKSPLLVLACTTAIFAALPVHFDFNAKTGFLHMSPAFALAESENDSDQVSGAGDDGADDHHSDNGSDGGSSDHDSDGDTGASDGGDNGDNGDSSADDGDSDTGNGTDDAGDDAGDDQSGSVDTGPEGNGTAIVKFESTEHSLHAVFADGTSVEIVDGQYERKDAAGNTVEERRATQADADRIVALR